MANEKPQPGTPQPKEAETESQEIGTESLDQVAGGLMTSIPGVIGGTPLSSTETDVCISQ